MTESDTEHLVRTREFFAARAERWDSRFGDDGPAYTAAIAEAEIPAGAVVVDLGCGTGRALTPLRAAVGPAGRVLGIDVTPEMLAAAADRGRQSRAALVLADASHLPMVDDAVDVIFASGLVNHLPDPAAGVRELARVTRVGGLLILFHPTGRAALAARHNRELRPDETLSEVVLGPLLASTGWRLRVYDDAASRFFALADRVTVAQPRRSTHLRPGPRRTGRRLGAT